MRNKKDKDGKERMKWERTNIRNKHLSADERFEGLFFFETSDDNELATWLTLYSSWIIELGIYAKLSLF